MSDAQLHIIDLEVLRLANLDFFDVADAMGSTKLPYGASVFVGFDTEYCPDEANPRKNRLLSVQLAYATRWETGRLLLLFPDGKRPSFRQLAKKIVRALTFPADIDTSRINLILIAHNAVAEWAHMADRDDKNLVKRLALIRKTTVTAHPLHYRVDAKTVADLSLLDTMLLAPDSRKSLEKLAELLGDDTPRKIPIERRYKKRMDLLLRDHPEVFARYAMRDAELCLALIFVLQRRANELLYGKLKEFFRTLASPTVKLYLLQNPEFKAYRDELQQPDFAPAVELAKGAYHGGLNDSFFIGWTAREFEQNAYLFFDFDLKNAYPSGLALCAKLDISRFPEVLPIEYRLTAENEAALLKDNVPAAVVAKVRDALMTSQAAFEKLLVSDKHCRRVAERIRHHCVLPHVKHLRQWRASWEAARRLAPDQVGHALIPGFAHVRFKFPVDIKHPVLFHSHDDYGLVYVREGSGTFTANEILLAEDAGAEITVLSSVSFPMERDAAGLPIFLFRDFVADLIRRRAEAEELKTDAGNVAAEILKTFANSAYGKIAQGINFRPVFHPSAGCTAPVDYSPITEPITASQSTGCIRAVLGAVFLAIERCNLMREREERPPLVVISATTDGFILGVPNVRGASAEDYYVRVEGDLKLRKKDPALRPEKLLTDFGCQDFLSLLKRQVPFIQLSASRYSITARDDQPGDPEPLEVKKVVDAVISIKTRGQVGHLKSGETPLLAKCGHRVPESWLVDHPDDDLPTGIDRNNREADWLIHHLKRREASDGED